MKKTASATLGIVLFISGVLIGKFEFDSVRAQESYPTTSKGVSVDKLGIISKESMTQQTGLEGYVLQLRVATMEPGGQIARHDHKTRPGLVYTLDGSWTEVRPDGEREYPAGEQVALLEDYDTDHWLYNRTDKPVTVLICDLDNR